MLQGLQRFWLLADNTDELPALSGGRRYDDARLTSEEWNTLDLLLKALEVRRY
jgi:hypothetical protein